MMQDRFGRTIDYLRVSVTDRCNFRCIYCMPEEGVPCTFKNDQLTADEMVRVIEVGVALGIRKVRLTGGEPLLRKDIVDIVARVATLPGLTDLSCTTNGFLLEEKASALKRAGLSRVNISLDTLDPERFQTIARRASLSAVWAGIEAAERANLTPIKINCVALKGLNDDEAADFAALTIERELHVRFIELMPIRWNLDDGPAMAPSPGSLLQLQVSAGGMLEGAALRRRMISAAELRNLVEGRFGPLQPASLQTNGPARTFRIPGALGTVGFISQISSDLCENCNRLRLTSDGSLRPCLMEDGEVSLRDPIRAGASDADLGQLFLRVVAAKPERHHLADGQRVVGRSMSQIGG